MVANLPRITRNVFTRKPLFHCLTTALLLLIPCLGAETAFATPISLAALEATDGEFESTNGALEFEDFEAHLIGSSDSDLARFLIVPLIDGFRLEVASGAFLLPGAELVLSFEVESEGEDEGEDDDGNDGHDRHSRDSDSESIRSMSLEILEASLLGRSAVIGALSAEMAAFADDEDDDPPIGELFAFTNPPGSLYAATDLASPEREIGVLVDLLSADMVDLLSRQRLVGEEVVGVEFRFSTQPIPEPSSFLLVAVGLLGLSARKRQSLPS